MGELHTTTTSAGRTLSWAEHGDPDGAPTVFLHGTPGSRVGQLANDDLYQRLGLRIIAPDRAGYGQSSPLPGRTVAASVPDVVTVLDALDVERAIIIGGSGGGPHALAIGALAPARTLAIGALVGAAPLNADEAAGQVGINQEMLARLSDLGALREKVAEAATVILEHGLGALITDAAESDRQLWHERDAAMRRTVAIAVECGYDGWVDDYPALWGKAWGFDAADVSVPVVWAHGTADRNVPLTAARRYAAGLPDCTFIEWADLGHAPGPHELAELSAAVLARGLRIALS